jgi:hypothetical protein
MADPKKKKHSMHGAMGALLDELDRTGAVSPQPGQPHHEGS